MDRRNEDVSRKIKVAFLLDTIDYQMGGTEKQILMILDHIDQNVFEVHLCCYRPSQWIRDHADRYNIFYFDFPSFRRLSSYIAFFRFVKFLKREHFDVLVSFFTDSNKIAVPACRLAGVRQTVFSRRNFNHWVTRTEGLILRMLNPFVSSYWVNAEAIKTRLIEQEKIPADTIEVIYNGYQLDEESADEGDPLRHIEQSKVVANVSNLRHVKGLDDFIRAIRLVVDKYDDVHFVVVGEGEQRCELEAMIADLVLAEHVTLLGKRNDVSNILRRADIGVLSSHSEGLSNAIIEYMAAGLPVVCTDVGGSAELVVDHSNGYLVGDSQPQQMARCILGILNDSGLGKKMGLASRDKAKEMFHRDIMIGNLSDYLKRLANS